MARLKRLIVAVMLVIKLKVNIMRYLITTKETYSPFLTKWFDPENHFNPEIDMTVYDLIEYKFTTDGINWHDIEIDHL